ncbi:MAG TPA: sigma 54-interacting transcriptional regulator [Polyangiaceae bacterium]|nr:sigma 54-interacting transcriptional regulator [Polyangiaceae bacterium]
MRSKSAEGDVIETRAAPGVLGAGGALMLVVLTGAKKGNVVALGARARIGKAPENDLVLPDDTVSRQHCELVREGDGVRVRDLGSTNGTRVDGTRVQDALLSPGAVLRVGEVEVALRPAPQRQEVLPSDQTRLGPALGKSLAMRTIFGVLERIAPTEATVLLEGETGTGKDVLARAIVEHSPRKSGPFVVVDCGAVSYSLIESELFGHERGAFTGAVSARQGAFELADGGTVFLDEIGELPLDVQPKLLRVLETREFRRVGGNKPLHTDVRVVAATKRDLKREVQGGKFREDLYFRLAVVPVTVPPLRERREDIPLLAAHILEAACAGGEPLPIASDAMQGLLAHDWPGNVRELRNVLERAVYMARATGASELGNIAMPTAAVQDASAFTFEPDKSYRDTRARFEQEFERRYVRWLLGRHGGNVSAAARDAKMDRKHLHELAKKHGIRGSEDD